MLTYTFSRREKVLILVLALVIVFIAWFVLVYQNTTNRLAQLDSEIANIETETTTANTRVSQMQRMQALIDQYKESGEEARVMPTFDNTTALMVELNGIMSASETYSLSFEDIDRESSPGYVLRGVRVDFGCNSYPAVESIINALAKGQFPCTIDSVAITDNTVRTGARVSNRTTGSSACSASVHVTFLEKDPNGAGSGAQSSGSAASSAAAAK